MKNLYVIFLSVIIYLLSFNTVKAYEIRGKVRNVSDSTYVSLSFINNIDEFFQLGHDMVIRKSKVNSDGTFVIKGNELFDDYRFYRLSFAIGENMINYTTGENRNTLTLYLNNSSDITIEFSIDDVYLSDVNIIDDNLFCNRLNDIDITIQTMIGDLFVDDITVVQKEMVRQKASEYVIAYVDTCELPIVKYYLYSYFVGYDLVSDKLTEDDVLELMKDAYPKSIYTKDLIKRSMRYEKQSVWYLWMIIILLFVYSVAVSVLYYRGKNKYNNVSNVLLTIKEREVLKLIYEGKINKEIASELSIEINTVKSHITNLYKKLNIRNRAQAADYYKEKIGY